MKNQALYTKYRPLNFNSVINQDIVVDFLQKSIANQRVNHFYIFSGSKGTGKTTTARIFSKALNCEQKGIDPCNKCNNCLSNINVIEIDAASNNGVENIRSLIEKSHQINLSGAYKVFIIDEAHMLSKSAFNAMLKTLEESSSGNVFILATTELEKIPDTIISRAINLYFNNIEIEHIQELITDIAAKESYQISEQAIEIIAKSSNNAARNALINLQKAAIYGNNIINEHDCSRLFQIVDFATIKSVYDTILNNFDTKDELIKSLSFIQNRFNLFLEQLLDYTLNTKNKPLFNYIMQIYEIYLKSLNANLCLKMLFEFNMPVQQTRSVKEVALTQPPQKKVQEQQQKSLPNAKNNLSDILDEATKSDRDLWTKRWLQNSQLIKQKDFMAVILLLLDSKIVAASKRGVVVCVEKEYAYEKLNSQTSALNKLLAYYSGYEMTCVVLTTQKWLLQRQKYLDQKKQKIKKQSVTDVFGAEIVEEI